MTDPRVSTGGEPAPPDQGDSAMGSRRSRFAQRLDQVASQVGTIPGLVDPVEEWQLGSRDRPRLIFAIGLAQRFGIEVFKREGTRSKTVFFRGRRAQLKTLEKSLKALMKAVDADWEEYFRDVVAPEAEVEFDGKAVENLCVENGEKNIAKSLNI